jgi:curved DNA-binding protein CbpA
LENDREEKLKKAYFVMGLEPGAALDKITRRHKRLIMVWHPDRFPTADGKKEAEEGTEANQQC